MYAEVFSSGLCLIECSFFCRHKFSTADTNETVSFPISFDQLLTSLGGCVQCRTSPKRSPFVVSCAKEKRTFVVSCSNLLMCRIFSLVSALAALSRLLNLVVSAWLATNIFSKCWHCSPDMAYSYQSCFTFFWLIGNIASCKIGVRFPILTTHLTVLFLFRSPVPQRWHEVTTTSLLCYIIKNHW